MVGFAWENWANMEHLFWDPGLKACLWDLDGTLIDSYPAIAASVNHVRKIYHFEPLPVSEIKSCVGRGIEHLLGSTVPGCDVSVASEIYGRHHAETLISGTVLLPGAASLLAALKELGVHHAICSNKPRRFSQQLIRCLGISSLLDALLGPEDVAMRKPAPDMLWTALSRLGFEKSQALFVGDMTVDIEAARAAGMRVAVVATGSDTMEDLQSSGPDFLAKDLSGLAVLLGIGPLAN